MNNRHRRVARLRWQEKKAREKKLRIKLETFGGMLKAYGICFESAVKAVRKAFDANWNSEELKEKYIAMKVEHKKAD